MVNISLRDGTFQEIQGWDQHGADGPESIFKGRIPVLLLGQLHNQIQKIPGHEKIIRLVG